MVKSDLLLSPKADRSCTVGVYLGTTLCSYTLDWQCLWCQVIVSCGHFQNNRTLTRLEGKASKRTQCDKWMGTVSQSLQCKQKEEEKDIGSEKGEEVSKNK